jgi:hypothetical protein
MSDVCPVGTVDEEGFAAPAPYKKEALLGFVAQDAVVEGVDDVEGGHEVKFVVKEWAAKGIAVLDGDVDVEWGMKVVCVFIDWQPCNSFSANIASWNKLLTILYFL